MYWDSAQVQHKDVSHGHLTLNKYVQNILLCWLLLICVQNILQTVYKISAAVLLLGSSPLNEKVSSLGHNSVFCIFKCDSIYESLQKDMGCDLDVWNQISSVCVCRV